MLIQFTFYQKGMEDPERPRTRARLLTRVGFKLHHADGPFSHRKNTGKFIDNVSLTATMTWVRDETAGLSHPGLRLDIRGQGKLDAFTIKAVEVAEYANPFRDGNFTPARIDAGVDYCGTGPVYPLGDAVILRRGTPSNTSTFGHDLSAYKLLTGPFAGCPVFFAEHYSVRAGIQPGVKVTKDTVLYDMHGQCVEMGWATADGSGSLGWSELGYHEGELSAIGLNMDQLVRSTGGPAGLTLGRPTTGHLPPGWPTI